MSNRCEAKQDLAFLLNMRGAPAHKLWREAYDVRKKTSDKIYLRGLVEFSNICAKDCYYCGIRASNTFVKRFTLKRADILRAAARASELGLGSVTLQSGEACSDQITQFVEDIVKQIKKDLPDLKIVLSCGEQSLETYHAWKKAGADRYLLKIETSSPDLYAKLHPADANHSLSNRMRCLHDLKMLGYQVGSGLMVGLPWQSVNDIASDILFFKELDIDMAGIGPYIAHSQTPLYDFKEELPAPDVRLTLTLNTIAALRREMPDINIAAATSLDALNPRGKELAVSAGANVIMVNLTPEIERPNYSLYQRPDGVLDKDILSELKKYGENIAFNEPGDSAHFTSRTK